MGVAATFIAGLLSKHRWIAWVGLVIILYVAVRMVYEGADQLLGHTLPAIPLLKGAAAVVAVRTRLVTTAVTIAGIFPVLQGFAHLARA